MRNILCAVLASALWITALPAFPDDPPAPAATLSGNTLRIDGQYAHIRGSMPVKDSSWFYSVERENDHLFIYSFWKIDEFQDTKEPNFGLYEAKSWTVQVMDSKDAPETALIFDQLDDFQFWGNVIEKDGEAQITISRIDGMPKGSYGSVNLKVLK